MRPSHSVGPRHRGRTAAGTALPLILLSGLAPGLLACGATQPAVDRPPLEFSAAAAPPAADASMHWVLPPLELEALLDQTLDTGDFEMRQLAATQYGGTGPKKVTFHFPEVGKDISFKWKPVPRNDMDEVNNSLRKEIAAYEIQKLFLDPEDYVVPTTVAHCVPLRRYRADYGKGRPSMEGADCVLGGLSVWIEDVTLSDELYDPKRFVADPVYASHMATFNLLTYLIDHRDARRSNFLIAKDPAQPRVFSVDNGIAFEPFLYNIFADNWNVLRVAALRRDHVERLRKLSREDLDVLGVVAHLERDERGVFRRRGAKKNLEPGEGVRMTGEAVQFGLTNHEIIRIWERIQTLIAEVDSGALPVF